MTSLCQSTYLQLILLIFCSSYNVILCELEVNYGKAGFLSSDSNILTGCGGVSRDPETLILYKPFENVRPNERCVWIIAPESANDFDIVPTFGFKADLGYLSFTGLRLYEDFLEQQMPRESGEVLGFYTNVLVVTFQSNNNVTGLTGFVLQVKRTGSSSAYANPNSTYEIAKVQSSNGLAITNHPPLLGSNYTFDELTVFIFPLKDNIFQNEERSLYFKEIELEDADQVYLYEFNSTTFVYDQKQRLNGDSVGTGKDILMVVFKSDYYDNYQGFYLATVNNDC